MFMDGVTPCSFSPSGGGRTAAAEWVRTAFHDFATHDAAAGTGGLDASIALEGARVENVGQAFNGTFNFFLGFYNARASMADLIALGTHVALRSCGGPVVPFRAGRADATIAGPSGVPEPTHNLSMIRTRFARAGFNTSDMIALTACGHTLGGVHGTDFPQITGNASQDSFPKFDTSYASFDNKVVTEYLSNKTANPLVVGPAATRSDARVFGADGNKTMRALADSKRFKATCAQLLQRMVESVPKTVQLTAPLAPYTVKPDGLQLALNANGTLTFSGRIRVRTTGLSDDQFVVTLPYERRDGSRCTSCTIATTRPTFQDGVSLGFDDTFAWYEFSKTLPTETSISSFNVTVKSMSGTKTYTNNGRGYPVNDRIMFQRAQSCLIETDDGAGNWPLTVVAAVRNGEPGPVALDLSVRKARMGTLVPALVPTAVTMQKAGAAPGGAPYTLYRAPYKLPISSWSTTFDVSLGTGKARIADAFKTTGVIAGADCVSLG